MAENSTSENAAAGAAAQPAPVPSRRTALRRAGWAAAGGALLAAGRPAAAVADERSGRPPRRGTRTYVLVHGTHSAGAYWAPIARELTLRGHRVVAVDQPLHGSEAFVPESFQRQDLPAMAVEPSPLAELTLDDFEQRVTRTVRRAARYGPVVLVGHSLGGASLSRVGNAVPGLLDHLCYMSAFCPTPGMPSADACTASPEGSGALSPVPYMIGDPEKLGVLRFNWRTGSSRDLAAFKAMICEHHPEGVFRQMLTLMQTDESVRTYAARAVGAAGTWGRIPRTYLRFGKDRMVTPALQDRMIAESDALTPDNVFRVHNFPDAPHIGPVDLAPVIEALDALGRR